MKRTIHANYSTVCYYFVVIQASFANRHTLLTSIPWNTWKSKLSCCKITCLMFFLGRALKPNTYPVVEHNRKPTAGEMRDSFISLGATRNTINGYGT